MALSTLVVTILTSDVRIFYCLLMHCEHTIFVMPPEGLAGISNAVFIKFFWKLLFEIFASKHLHLLWTQYCCALYTEY